MAADALSNLDVSSLIGSLRIAGVLSSLCSVIKHLFTTVPIRSTDLTGPLQATL